jgi:hypothetical protein
MYIYLRLFHDHLLPSYVNLVKNVEICAFPQFFLDLDLELHLSFPTVVLHQYLHNITSRLLRIRNQIPAKYMR